ncbi:MAG: hypothetical protein LBJ91_05810 [Clostridiales Family XIII bacterium]|jgi:hypothetical protein|nr:hypothetical protein [Clostridiales Family XIII bacterium]
MRNFLYNKSDILIAIIIIAAAAIIIWSRVDAIMGSDEGDDGASPAVAAGEELPAPDVETSEGAVVETPPPEGGEVAGETPVDGGEALDPDGEATDGEAPVEDGESIEFTVEVGSAASTVADDLASSGLVESSEAFLNELTAQNAETKLKAGTFEIVPGTSVADIVKKLTA